MSISVCTYDERGRVDDGDVERQRVDRLSVVGACDQRQLPVSPGARERRAVDERRPSEALRRVVDAPRVRHPLAYQSAHASHRPSVTPHSTQQWRSKEVVYSMLEAA